MPQIAGYDATEVNELSRLVPPTALAHDWGVILGDLHLNTEYVSAVARYAQAKELAAARPSLQKAQRLYPRLVQIETRNGLTSCAAPK